MSLACCLGLLGGCLVRLVYFLMGLEIVLLVFPAKRFFERVCAAGATNPATGAVAPIEEGPGSQTVPEEEKQGSDSKDLEETDPICAVVLSEFVEVPSRVISSTFPELFQP